MTILLTGATGLVGAATLQKLAEQHEHARFVVLVRSPGRWRALAPTLGSAAARVHAIAADLRQPGLGISAGDRALLRCHDIDAIIHCGADVCFSRPLADARAVNTEGTRRMIALAQELNARCFVYVSTAFVAGRRSGSIAADLQEPSDGWVNAYEQSKFEAELLVTSAQLPYVIVRPSIIVCDDLSGRVSQYNSVHRALNLCYSGLASMLCGREDSPVDVVPADYVAGAIAQLATCAMSRGRIYHLCAGERALRLGQLLDRCFAIWSRDPSWRRRSIPQPALTDLNTYQLFEQAVEQTADERLRAITRALGHFAPQLYYRKVFDTQSTEQALGYSAPAPETYWEAVIEGLQRDHWRSRRNAA